MVKLKVEGTTLGRVIDLFINSLIIISIVSFSIETLPNLPSEIRDILQVINLVTIIVFSIEYVYRVSIASNKIKYIFSLSGLIDLAAILPFYISQGGIDLRSLRIFRLIRLVKLLKSYRLQRAIEHIKSTLNETKEELQVFSIFMFFTLYLAAVGIYYFENPAQPEVFSSVFSSLWWSVTSLTTVGYGDMCPITVGGKIFTMFVLLIGLGIVAIPTGILSSALRENK